MLRRAVLSLVALALPALAHAVRPGPPVVVVPQPGAVYPIPYDCWYEQHYFDSLRTGPIEYCRKNLRFRPGALECLTYRDRVCTVLLADGEWDEVRTSDVGQLIRCPDGPEPPTCPRLGPVRNFGSTGRR